MGIGMNLPAELLAAYKIKVQDKMEQGFEFADVPCELLYALIERAEAWERLQADEPLIHREKELHGTPDVG